LAAKAKGRHPGDATGLASPTDRSQIRWEWQAGTGAAAYYR
jgi:hypothetical protein